MEKNIPERPYLGIARRNLPVPRAGQSERPHTTTNSSEFAQPHTQRSQFHEFATGIFIFALLYGRDRYSFTGGLRESANMFSPGDV
jgi:hypothetical protein